MSPRAVSFCGWSFSRPWAPTSVADAASRLIFRNHSAVASRKRGSDSWRSEQGTNFPVRAWLVPMMEATDIRDGGAAGIGESRAHCSVDTRHRLCGRAVAAGRAATGRPGPAERSGRPPERRGAIPTSKASGRPTTTSRSPSNARPKSPTRSSSTARNWRRRWRRARRPLRRWRTAAAVGAGPPHWYENLTARSRRSSLIIDPPNGRLPALTPAARQRAAAAERPSERAVPPTRGRTEACGIGASPSDCRM